MTPASAAVGRSRLGPAGRVAINSIAPLRQVAIGAGCALMITIACSKSAPVNQVQTASNVPKTPSVTIVANASVLITETPERPTLPIETLLISPSSIVADPGEIIQLSAEAVGPGGEPLSEVEFAWAMTDYRAGTIDREGRFQVGTKPGSYKDIISVTGIQNTPAGIRYASAFASVTVIGEVEVPKLASLVFIPDNPTLLEQQIVRLRAVGFDESGLVIPGVNFVWKLNDPTLGRINGIGYLTVEGPAGTYERAVGVVAIWEGHRIAAQTDVQVIATNDEVEDLLNVHALPQRFFLDPGDRLQLSAVALNGLGELVASTELRWSMNDSRAGTIDGNGNFIAGASAGVFTEAVKVEAVIPGELGFVMAVDFASVVIRQKQSSGRLKALSITPSTIVSAPGGRATVIVSAVDELGNPADHVAVSWKVLNQLAGEISDLGAFKAGGTPGHYKESLYINVDQHVGDEVITRSKTIDVVITGTLSRTVLQPAMAVVAPGRTIHFSATGFDENDVALPGLVVIWKVHDKTLGTIDAFGNFTAGHSPGMYPDVIEASIIHTLPTGY